MTVRNAGSRRPRTGNSSCCPSAVSARRLGRRRGGFLRRFRPPREPRRVFVLRRRLSPFSTCSAPFSGSRPQRPPPRGLRRLGRQPAPDRFGRVAVPRSRSASRHVDRGLLALASAARAAPGLLRGVAPSALRPRAVARSAASTSLSASAPFRARPRLPQRLGRLLPRGFGVLRSSPRHGLCASASRPRPPR